MDHDNSEENRVFQEVTEVGRSLEKIKAVKGSYKKAKVGIIFDWAKQLGFGGCTGIFSTKQTLCSNTLQEHYRSFWNADIPVEVITPESDLGKYDLVIAPMLYLIEEETMDKFTEYVTQGGRLVSTYVTGYVNENGFNLPQRLAKEAAKIIRYCS
ncbi:beta-galactosidase trimerization domain-containing protein [uncultured Enterococcus sp.]|uniref:beta-galactosidase trimerization domain-containing protein n=1 Tax=uncultured Enterococcus sp. TaxID=167972 RepID=UPI002AA82D0B|nr:beta-galactosidase trimerization domain-containing protein [uncultured Enterococcus sp.]